MFATFVSCKIILTMKMKESSPSVNYNSSIPSHFPEILTFSPPGGAIQILGYQ